MQLFEVLQEVYPTLLEGLGMTVQITVLSLLIAMVLGIFVCLMNISNNVVLRGIAKFYIWLIRGTPMLVQAFYFYFAMPQLIQSITGSQFRITVFTASLVTLTLNAGAYISEIFRGSIESVNKGQMEAGYCAGMTYPRIMTRIILPQAARTAFPPLSNSLIGLLKDTSLASNITIMEMFMSAQRIAARTYDSFALYCEVALIYLLFCTILTKVQRICEKKLELN